MGKSLIVNADDLGWSAPVNAGIIEAHTHGVVTSATLMTTMPGAEDALVRLGDCPALGIGVHLTLSAGKPVSPDASVRKRLAPGGTFPNSLMVLLGRARTSKRWRQSAEIELAAQIEWTLKGGLKPDHLDSHKHMHVVEPFPEIVATLAQRYGIRRVRTTCERHRVRVGHVPMAARLRRGLLLRWGGKAERVFAEAGLIQPETLFGIEDTGRPSPARFGAFLEGCEARSVEWMVHPGNREETPTAPTRLVESRPAEKMMLTDPGLRDIMATCGFQLVRFEELSE